MNKQVSYTKCSTSKVQEHAKLKGLGTLLSTSAACFFHYPQTARSFPILHYVTCNSGDSGIMIPCCESCERKTEFSRLRSSFC